jgi:DNA-binding SARP family transcriptional activator
MSMLQITVLGKPTVCWAEQAVQVPGGRTSALLYRLAAQSEPVPREHLGFLFWPRESEDRMRRNVARICSQLQRILPTGNALIMDGEGVSLNPAQVWSDAILFMQLAQDYNRTPRMVLLCALIDLYKGPFLDGFSLTNSVEHKAWVNLARRRWERHYLTALKTLVEQSMKLGDFAQAIDAAQRYLELNPQDEAMHRRLIELFGVCGDGLAAQSEYDTCSEILRREQGRDPTDATTVAYRSAMVGALDFRKTAHSFEPHLDFADQQEGRRQWQYEPKLRRQRILLF